MNYIQTFTGLRFDFDNIPNNIIDIKDIAHALSNLCRFIGHTMEFYSVAQHSDLCVKVALEQYKDKTLAKLMLLHDATEAYLGDVSRPLKKVISDIYVPLEEKLHTHIYSKFNLLSESRELKNLMKEIDNRMLFTERRDLLEHELNDWTDTQEPYEFIIRPLTPFDAENYFLETYKFLFE